MHRSARDAVPPTHARAEAVGARAGIDVLAFDLDGTLVDSAPDLNHCLGRALETLGFDSPTESQTRSWIGDGVEELVRHALDHGAPAAAPSVRPSSHDPEGLVLAAIDAFSACYAQNLYVRSRLYPHALETLDALRAQGMRLCCVTNKRLRFAEALLDEAGILDRFELVIGGDSVSEKKPSPMPLLAAAERLRVEPSSAMFVGDSDHDMHAAEAAGWRFIWAAYGYRRIEPANRVAVFTLDALSELEGKLRGYGAPAARA